MSLLSPDYYLKDLTCIDPHDLKKRGIKAVLLDRDNTLVSREKTEASDEVIAWIHSLKEHDLKVMLVSNSFSPMIAKEAEALGIDYIDRALKPLPIGVSEAMRRLEVDKLETAMVGDQIFTDVVAANLSGVVSILVEPLTSVDLWHTVQLRKVEALVLGGREAQESLDAS